MAMRPPRRGASSDARDRDERLSRFLALVLRHKPESVGLALDPAGFVDIDTMVAALAAQPGWSWVNADAVRQLAQQDSRRYEIAENRIRARYGHTVPIDTPGTPVVPPEWLYYGVPPASLDQLRAEGLHPQERQFVHLSATRQDALAIAQRRDSDALVITILGRQASGAGVPFFQASAGIYLTRAIPPQFLLLPNPRTSA